jgi:AAA domain
LKVIRIGKPSAVTQSLWNMTLEAAIDRDPNVQKARDAANQVSEQQQSQLHKKSKSSVQSYEQRSIRTAAMTTAVKASIEASNIAATKALREADVIVSTLTGSSDPRLLAACGIIPPTADLTDNNPNSSKSSVRKNNIKSSPVSSKTSSSFKGNTAPDGQPPLSLPFVIIDEACQALETATLIPIVSSNSCRAVVLLGDPCQLPPTGKFFLYIPINPIAHISFTLFSFHFRNTISLFVPFI